jgi:hypothetical protein
MMAAEYAQITKTVRRRPVVSIFRPEGRMEGEDLLPRVRRDALSDDAHYLDSGCELARSCLRCPLPRCQHDEPGRVRAWLTSARDREIARLRTEHRAPIEALAETYGLERRTIFRILGDDPRRARKGKRMEVRG